MSDAAALLVFAIAALLAAVSVLFAIPWRLLAALALAALVAWLVVRHQDRKGPRS